MIPEDAEDQSSMSAVESCLSRSPRFKLLLSIFILQSFLTLAGLVMTDSTISSGSSSKTYSNSSITAQVSVCPPVTSSLNPWACDLIRAQRFLGQESSSSSSRCKSSANNFIGIIKPPSKCLLLTPNLKTPNRETHICENSSMDRKRHVSSYTLSFCHKFSLPILTDGSWISVNTSQCQSLIEALITDLNKRDKIARKVSCHFDALIARYNCQTGYSVQWNCEECSNTYRDWICATLLPVLDQGTLRKPCGSFCKRVEQRCPYLHPLHKEQYAGEPAFICIDPHIPFIPSLTPVIPFDDSEDCFDECFLANKSTCFNSSCSSSLPSNSFSSLRDTKMQSDDSSKVSLPDTSMSATSIPVPDSADQDDSEEKLQSEENAFEELDSLKTPESGKS